MAYAKRKRYFSLWSGLTVLPGLNNVWTRSSRRERGRGKGEKGGKKKRGERKRETKRETERQKERDRERERQKGKDRERERQKGTERANKVQSIKNQHIRTNNVAMGPHKKLSRGKMAPPLIAAAVSLPRNWAFHRNLTWGGSSSSA